MRMMRDKATAKKLLHAHAEHFQKKIYQITDNIHVAVGYAASNVSMIEGQTGLIIIDTTESTSAAENILKDFREISDKPIKAIIYTHSHRDHIGGAAIFAGDMSPAIYASANFKSDLIDAAGAGAMPMNSLLARTKAQFGMGLTSEERVHIGLGPEDRPLNGLGQGFVAPTNRFADVPQDLEIDGVNLHVFPAPGETADHVNIWLEDEKLLFCGDNYYQAFPNLYAIRGTAYRDFESWANTLNQLLQFPAEILVSGHGQPVFGSEDISERLTDYRDAINSVIEQAIAGMNAGLSFDEIAAQSALPDRLVEKPWLIEHYGSFAYAIKACCVGLMGWYSGNVEELVMRSPKEKAADWLALLGGVDALLLAVEDATISQNHALVLELCEMARHLDLMTDPLHQMRRQALCEIAEQTYNAPVRNSLFSAVMDMDNKE